MLVQSFGRKSTNTTKKSEILILFDILTSYLRANQSQIRSNCRLKIVLSTTRHPAANE